MNADSGIHLQMTVSPTSMWQMPLEKHLHLLCRSVMLKLNHLIFIYYYHQIQKSPQAHTFLKLCCREVNIPTLQLLMWIQTRWASLYNFMDRLITLRPVRVSGHTFNIPRTVLWQAVTHFVQLADDSEDVPNLNKK